MSEAPKRFPPRTAGRRASDHRRSSDLDTGQFLAVGVDNNTRAIEEIRVRTETLEGAVGRLEEFMLELKTSVKTLCGLARAVAWLVPIVGLTIALAEFFG